MPVRGMAPAWDAPVLRTGERKRAELAREAQWETSGRPVAGPCCRTWSTAGLGAPDPPWILIIRCTVTGVGPKIGLPGSLPNKRGTHVKGPKGK